MVKLSSGPPAETPKNRCSPGNCCGNRRRRIVGHPDPEHVSTSDAERQNLTMRMGTAAVYARDERLLRRFKSWSTCSTCTSCTTTSAAFTGPRDESRRIRPPLEHQRSRGPGGQKHFGGKLTDHGGPQLVDSGIRSCDNSSAVDGRRISVPEGNLPRCPRRMLYGSDRRQRRL